MKAEFINKINNKSYLVIKKLYYLKDLLLKND